MATITAPRRGGFGSHAAGRLGRKSGEGFYSY